MAPVCTAVAPWSWVIEVRGTGKAGILETLSYSLSTGNTGLEWGSFGFPSSSVALSEKSSSHSPLGPASWSFLGGADLCVNSVIGILHFMAGSHE